MPGGFGDPTGFLVFGAIKMLGYSAYALYLNQTFPVNRRNPFFVGFCRMILGIGFGTIVGILGIVAMMNTGILGFVAYLALLIPLRAVEWWIILNTIYKVNLDFDGAKLAIAMGIFVSFALDIPAILGLFVTGGLWIC